MTRTRARRALVCVALLGLAPSSPPVVTYIDVLPTSFNPLRAGAMADLRAQELVFDRIVFPSAIHSEIDSDVLVQNPVAPYNKLERLDGGKRIRMWIRPGLSWHDGKPVTAKDACFTLLAFADRAVADDIRMSHTPQVVGCEVEDESAFVYAYDIAPHHPYGTLNVPLLPEHAFRGRSPTDPSAFDEHPIGTGPYAPSKTKDGWVFTAMPGGVRTARIPKLRLVPPGDPATDVARLLSGEVSGMVDTPRDRRPDIAAADDVALKSYDLRTWWFVALDTRDAPFSDVHARRAFEAGIDRAGWRENYFGVDPNDDNPPVEFVSGPFVQSSPYYNRQIKARDRDDPEALRDEMTAAGFARVDGVWTDASGVPLRLCIGVDPEIDLASLQAALVAYPVDGVSVTLSSLTPEAWAAAMHGDGVDAYDALMGQVHSSWPERVDPYFDAPGPEYGRWNPYGYRDPEVEQDFVDFRSATNDAEAREAMHRLHAHLAEQRPWLFLWKADTKSAWRTEIRNNTIAPVHYFLHVDGWRRE